jgi:hypothetical protein
MGRTSFLIEQISNDHTSETYPFNDVKGSWIMELTSKTFKNNKN